MRAVRLAAAATFAGLVSGVSAASCGGGAGQLIVAVQTDLDIPKDIDEVQIVISVGNSVPYQDTFKLVGAKKSALRLPATLSMFPPEDPNTPVHVSVNGFKNGALRVAREAETTIPKDRLATLHVKLQVLCVDYVTTDTGKAVYLCVDGLTCISGTCQSVEVDEKSLPDFGEEDVFGGGDGSGTGSCFDVVKCFKGALPLEQLDKEACTYAVTGDPSALNVAALTEGAGICGLSSCYVALDANSPAEGWTPVPGAPGVIALPKGVCNPTGPAVARDVVAAPVTAACPQKTVKLPICGPFSSAGGPAEAPDQPGLAPIATSQAHPVSVMVDGQDVYWANAGLWPADGKGQQTGLVRRALLGGGPTATIDKGVRSPRSVVLAEGSVFFTDADPALMKAEQVMRLGVPDFAGLSLAPMPLVSTALPEGIAASGNTIFWTEFGTGTIRRMIYNDGAVLEGQNLAEDQNRPLRIVADESFACWTNEGELGAQDGSVACKGVTAAAMTSADVIWQGEATPRAIALTSDAVYWATFTSPGMIRRGARQGSSFAGDAEDMVTTEGFPNGVAVDGTHIYWTTWGDGAVWRLPLAPAEDEEPERLVRDQNRPSAITVTKDAIYWVNEGDPNTANGSVMRFAKPE